MDALIPELSANAGALRLPPLRNAPLTPRIARLIDHPVFQRLRHVRQLGPTHLVYPGAVHTRFEHSIGVYDMTLRYLRSLLGQEDVHALLAREDLVVSMLAGLLHDVGHYPFAHGLEAVHVPGHDTPRHEDLAARLILEPAPFAPAGEPTLGALIAAEFDVDPQEVADMIVKKPHQHERASQRFVGTILSSGVDADKADYLERDSVHMGVAFGRSYDRDRFISGLCLHPDGDRLAILPKARVQVEAFIFGRHSMFSEAYWHHTVRSVSTMVEHALYDFRARTEMPMDELESLLLSTNDDQLLAEIAQRSGPDSTAGRILACLLNFRRSPYKRILTLSRVYDDRDAQIAYERIYHLDGAGRDALRASLRNVLNTTHGLQVEPHELLIDTPPRDKDHLEVPDVVTSLDGTPRATPFLSQSKVVQGIATDFIKVVKRIRIFVHPRIARAIEERALSTAIRRELLAAILAFAPESDFQQSII